MKFVINPIVRTILILGVWLLCFRKISLDFNHSYFLDFTRPLLFFLAGIVSLLSFFVDYRRYKAEKRLAFFTPTAASLLCIIALIGTNQHLKQQDRTPTILYASKFYSGLNTISIDFRENGTYKCKKSSFMGDGYYIRGRYSIKDSVIYLDKSNLYDLVRTDRLEMMTILKSAKGKNKNLLTLLFGESKPDTLPETYLFQIDAKGDTIPSAIVLRVNNDVVRYRD